MNKPKFSLGTTLATPNALRALEEAEQSASELLYRHCHGDFGDLCDEDKQANEQALLDGGRIFSAYLLSSGERIWVITEADRSSTCCLKPEDY